MKIVVRVVLCVVLAIAVLVGGALTWFSHAYGGGGAPALAKARAFCDAVAIGADISSVGAGRRGGRQSPVGNEYRYAFISGGYQEADCRVQVDAHGKVVAKRAGAYDTFPRDPASTPSAPLSR